MFLSKRLAGCAYVPTLIWTVFAVASITHSHREVTHPHRAVTGVRMTRYRFLSIYNIVSTWANASWVCRTLNLFVWNFLKGIRVFLDYLSRRS